MGIFSDIGGGIGELFGGSEQSRLANEYAKHGADWLASSNPDIAVQTLGPSAFQSLSVDPATRDAEMSALGGYKDIIAGGGLDAMDRAKLAQIQSTQAGQTNAAEAGLREDAARRGQATSNAAAQRAAVAAGADRAAAQGTDVAAQAEANRRAALGQYGQMAAGIHGQDYGEAANRAQAADTTNRLNWQNKQQQLQQNFGNRLGLSGAYGNLSGIQRGNAAQASQMYGSAGAQFGDAGDKIMSAFGGGGM